MFTWSLGHHLPVADGRFRFAGAWLYIEPTRLMVFSGEPAGDPVDSDPCSICGCSIVHTRTEHGTDGLIPYGFAVHIETLTVFAGLACSVTADRCNLGEGRRPRTTDQSLINATTMTVRRISRLDGTTASCSHDSRGTLAVSAAACLRPWLWGPHPFTCFLLSLTLYDLATWWWC